MCVCVGGGGGGGGMSVFTCSNPGSLWYGFSFNNDWIDINILDKLWAGLQAGPDHVLKIKDKT